MITEVVKRDGTHAKFSKKKIVKAIYKAMLAIKKPNMTLANEYAEEIIKRINVETIDVEKIQNIVIDVLAEHDKYLSGVYSSYREERALLRVIKKSLNVEDDLKLPKNSIEILESRYLLKDENGVVKETPKQLFERVGKAVAVAELAYSYVDGLKFKGDGITYFGEFNIKNAVRVLEYIRQETKHDKIQNDTKNFLKYCGEYGGFAIDYAEKFIKLMSSLTFLPNTPTLMNAGTELGSLSACFVLPVEDSLEDIFDAVKNTALIHKTGGGTGFNFSKLRPKNDFVKSTQGVASGPVSFMKVFDSVTEEIKQGGKRRGANMAILKYNHPDIMEFVLAKDTNNVVLKNFNVSVAVDEDFFKALQRNDYIEFHSPRRIGSVGHMKAKDLFDTIALNAWKSGDPGLIFLDRVNEDNFLEGYGDIEATNPCGEQPLHDYESCNLGSINLAKFVDSENNFMFKEFENTVKLATRFLDDVVDVNVFPIPQLLKMNRESRRIGLGVMGLADMFVEMGIKYDSLEALNVASLIMETLQKVSYETSEYLAREKYPYPNVMREQGIIPGHYYSTKQLENRVLRRNSAVQSIAPTGTISIIANCSSSIEPYFALAYKREYNAVGVGAGLHTLYERNAYLEKELRKQNLYSDNLIAQIAQTGSLQEAPNIPQSLKDVFVTAHDIDAEWHIMMQSVFQTYCDSGVSKTINLPNSASVDDVKKAYLMARELGCKGITVFRDGCKSTQVLKHIDEVKPESTKPTVDLTFELNNLAEGSCVSGKCSL